MILLITPTDHHSAGGASTGIELIASGVADNHHARPGRPCYELIGVSGISATEQYLLCHRLTSFPVPLSPPLVPAAPAPAPAPAAKHGAGGGAIGTSGTRHTTTHRPALRAMAANRYGRPCSRLGAHCCSCGGGDSDRKPWSFLSPGELLSREIADESSSSPPFLRPAPPVTGVVTERERGLMCGARSQTWGLGNVSPIVSRLHAAARIVGQFPTMITISLSTSCTSISRARCCVQANSAIPTSGVGVSNRTMVDCFHLRWASETFPLPSF